MSIGIFTFIEHNVKIEGHDSDKFVGEPSKFKIRF